jgi:hypothetical protein
MQGKGSAFCGSATSLEVRYTDKPVSGWGGLVAVQRYLEKRGVAEVLVQALPDGRTLYLQHSKDLSESGRDRPSLPEVFKTVGSAGSSRPDNKTQGPNSRQGNQPVSRKDGWSVGESNAKSGVRWNRCV